MYILFILQQDETEVVGIPLAQVVCVVLWGCWSLDNLEGD